MGNTPSYFNDSPQGKVPDYFLDGITDKTHSKPPEKQSTLGQVGKVISTPYDELLSGAPPEKANLMNRLRDTLVNYGTRILPEKASGLPGVGKLLPKSVGDIELGPDLIQLADALYGVPTAAVEAGREMTSPVGIATSLTGLGGAGKLGTVGKVAGTGLSAYFGAKGLEEAGTTKDKDENYADYLGRILSGTGQALMGGAGAVEGGRELATKTPKFSPEKGYKNLLKGGLSSTGPEFKDLHDELVNSGHLTNLVENPKYNISKSKDAPTENKILRQYLDDWHNSTIEPAIARHPNETINGNDFVPALQTLLNPIIDAIMPERASAINDEMLRFMNKKVPLPDAQELLARLNAANAEVEDSSAEDSAKILRKSGTKAALDKATETLRNKLYEKLDSVGEKGIKRSQREYGLVKEFKEHVYDNIQRSEEAEASKPGYSPEDLALRSLSRHPIITGGAVIGALSGHPGIAEGGALALPAVEAIKTAQERANTPNALRRVAYNAYRGGPQVRMPKYEPPPIAAPSNVPSPNVSPQLPPTMPQSPSSVAPPEVPPTQPINPETPKSPYSGIDDESLKLLYKFKPSEPLLQEIYKRGLSPDLENVLKTLDKEEKPKEVKPLSNREMQMERPSKPVKPYNYREEVAGRKTFKEQPKPVKPIREEISTLPSDLRGSKPRYGYGNKLFELQFDSDVDKALYTVAQDPPNKAQDRFMSFLRKNLPNKTDEQIIGIGKSLKNAIKGMASKSDPEQGPLKISRAPSKENPKQELKKVESPRKEISTEERKSISGKDLLKKLLEEESGEFTPGKIKDYIRDDGWLTKDGEFIPKLLDGEDHFETALRANLGQWKKEGNKTDSPTGNAIKRGHVAFRTGSSSPSGTLQRGGDLGYFEGAHPDKNTLELIKHALGRLDSSIKRVSIGIGDKYLPPSSRGEALRWLESLK